MGLLDSILSGVANNALGRASGMGMGGGLLGGRGGRANVLMALLPVVLTMLSNRRGGAGVGRSAMPGGGLGGLGALAGIGGLGALLNRFQQNGFGQHAQSWVGTGQNQPIPPEAMSQVFNPNELSQIASQAGVNEDEARTGLAALLPHVIDHLTPHGQLPSDDQLESRVGELQQEVEQQRTV